MDKRKWVVLWFSFQFAVLAILAGFIYRHHLELTHIRFEPDYTAVFAPAEAVAPPGGAAAAKAETAAFTGHRQSIFTYVGAEEAELPVYKFQARVDGGDFIAEVCRESGRVLRTANSRQVRTAALTTEEGLEIAETFLRQNGHENMVLRHWRREANRVAARFVSVQDGTLIYPDSVSLTVALDNGRIVGFSAVEYASNHRAREEAEPAVTKEEAMLAVPAALTVEEYDMALIAASCGREILTYAFRGRAADGRAYLAYVDAELGLLRELRFLVEDETGVFPL